MENTLGGVLCFNKPAGCTSHDIVYKVRKLYGTRQVGHTGTLDPLATGVLVVMVGRAVKASEFLTADEKEYVATLKLGITTDTEDITGNVLSKYDGQMPALSEVENAALSFLGEIQQIPPMYSAIKVDGKKLMDMARKGQTVQREPRTVRVERIKVYETEKKDEFLLNVRVSKGTYIRTLCADIGKKLGTGGVMSTLTRTSSGSFGIEEGYTEQALSEMSMQERYAILRPTEELFADLPQVRLSDFFAKLGACGCPLYQKKLGTSFECDTLVRLSDKNGFFALGRVVDTEDGSAIKPIKQFRI